MAELELEIDFSGRVFFLEFVEYINFTVSHSGACLLRTPTRTSTCANAFLLCRSSRLVPTCCVRRKQAHHPPCPSRTGGGVFGRCRCAPRPDPFGWALAQPRRSLLLARRRAARDSLKGSRRSRAPRPPSFRQLSHRARLFACTFSLPCQGLGVGFLVVSYRENSE